MTLQKALEANLTNVRYAIEASEGVLPGSPEWVLLEPNTEPRFGAELTTVERNPIDDDRMSDPGSITDKNPGVQIEQDFTLDNQMVPLQSFMLAALAGRVQHTAITAIDAAANEFEAASGLDAFVVNNLVLAVGFGPGIDGLHLVTSAAAGALGVSTDLPALAVIPAGARLIRVGHEYASGDISVDASGVRPRIVSAAADLRLLGLEPGCSLYIGGDVVANQFATAADNGEKRVFAVDAVAGDFIEVDRSFADMVTDAGGGKSIRLFPGISLKNKKGAGRVRTYLQLERTLGAPDDAQPTQIQSEYVTGCTGGEYALSVPRQDKVTSSMTFTGMAYETRDAVTGVKTGTRTDLVPSDAINTSSDLKRLEVVPLPTADEAPPTLFGLTSELTLTIQNNIRRRTAHGVVGAASLGVGELDISGTLDAFFTNVSQVQSIHNYEKFTIHGFFATAANQGFSLDMPLVTLSTDGADVENNEDIMLSCNYTAHNGRRYHPTFDHALCWSFFPYLPTLARTVL